MSDMTSGAGLLVVLASINAALSFFAATRGQPMAHHASGLAWLAAGALKFIDQDALAAVCIAMALGIDVTAYLAKRRWLRANQ